MATDIGFGIDSANKPITKYFRKGLWIENFIYKLSACHNDGIVVYINGKEVLRDNMPEGEITKGRGIPRRDEFKMSGNKEKVLITGQRSKEKVY